MTNRYQLLLDAIHQSNSVIEYMFLFAITVVIAYVSLEWTPAFMRRPVKRIYLITALVLFFLVTVFSGLS